MPSGIDDNTPQQTMSMRNEQGLNRTPPLPSGSSTATSSARSGGLLGRDGATSRGRVGRLRGGFHQLSGISPKPEGATDSIQGSRAAPPSPRSQMFATALTQNTTAQASAPACLYPNWSQVHLHQQPLQGVPEPFRYASMATTTINNNARYMSGTGGSDFVSVPGGYPHEAAHSYAASPAHMATALAPQPMVPQQAMYGMPSAACSAAPPTVDAELFHHYYYQCMRYQQQCMQEQYGHFPPSQQPLLQVMAPMPYGQVSQPVPAAAAYPQLRSETWNPSLGARPTQGASAAAVGAASAAAAWSPTTTPQGAHTPGPRAPTPPLDSLLSEDSSSLSGGRLTPFNITAYADDHCLLCGEEGHCYAACQAAQDDSVPGTCSVLCFFNEHDKHVYVMNHGDWVHEASLADVVAFVERAMHLPRAMCELWLDGRSLAAAAGATALNGEGRSMLLPPRDLRTKCCQLRLLPGAVVYVAAPGVWDRQRASASSLAASVPRSDKTAIPAATPSGTVEAPAPTAPAAVAKEATTPPPDPTTEGSVDVGGPRGDDTAPDAAAASTAEAAAAAATGEMPCVTLSPLSAAAGDATKSDAVTSHSGTKTTAAAVQDAVDISSISVVPSSGLQSLPLPTLEGAAAAAAAATKGDSHAKKTTEDSRKKSKADTTADATTKKESPQPWRVQARPMPKKTSSRALVVADAGTVERRVHQLLHVSLHTDALEALEAIAASRTRDQANPSYYNATEARRARTLHVKFLPETLSFVDIRKLFFQFGQVLRVRVICPNQHATSRGSREHSGSLTRPATRPSRPAGGTRKQSRSRAKHAFYVGFVEYSCQPEAVMAKCHLEGRRMPNGYYLSVEWCRQPITGGYRTDYDAVTGKPCTFGLTHAEIDEVNLHYGFHFTPHTVSEATSVQHSPTPQLGAATATPLAETHSKPAQGQQQKQQSRTDVVQLLRNALGMPASEPAKRLVAAAAAAAAPLAAATQAVTAAAEETAPEKEVVVRSEKPSPVVADFATPKPGSGETSAALSVRSVGPLTGASASATTQAGFSGGGRTAHTSKNAAALALPPLSTVPSRGSSGDSNEERNPQRAERLRLLAANVLCFFYPPPPAPSLAAKRGKSPAPAFKGTGRCWSNERLAEIRAMREKLHSTAANYARTTLEPMFHTAMNTALDLLPLVRAPDRARRTRDINSHSTSDSDADDRDDGAEPHPLLLQLETIVYCVALHVHHDEEGDGRAAARLAQRALDTVNPYARDLTQLQFLCAASPVSGKEESGSHSNRSPRTSATCLVRSVIPCWAALFSAVPLGEQFSAKAMRTAREDGVIVALAGDAVDVGSEYARTTSGSDLETEEKEPEKGKEEDAATREWSVEGDDSVAPKRRAAVVAAASARPAAVNIPFPRLDVACCLMERLLQLALMLDVYMVTGRTVARYQRARGSQGSQEAPATPPPPSQSSHSADSSMATPQRTEAAAVPKLRPSPFVPAGVSPLALPPAAPRSSGSDTDGDRDRDRDPDRSLSPEDEAELLYVRRVKIELVSVAEQLYRHLDALHHQGQRLREVQACLRNELGCVVGARLTTPTSRATSGGSSSDRHHHDNGNDNAGDNDEDRQRSITGMIGISTQDSLAAQRFWVSLRRLVEDRMPSCAAISGTPTSTGSASSGSAPRKKNSLPHRPPAGRHHENSRDDSTGSGASSATVTAGAGVLLAGLAPAAQLRFAAALLSDPVSCELL